MARITAKGIGVRFLVAFALVCLTWNPTRYNYVAWALNRYQEMAPLVAFVSIVFAIAWIFFVRATMRSLGAVGLVLAGALAATVLWILFYYHLVDTASTTLVSWIVLALLAAILAAGMSWSHLRRSWAGQADVDEVDAR